MKTFRVSWEIDFDYVYAKDKQSAMKQVKKIVNRLYATTPMSNDGWLECEEEKTVI